MCNNIDLVLIVILLLSACTKLTVNPVNQLPKISSVCIVYNPSVVVLEFLNDVRDSFKEKGIATHIIENTTIEACDYTVTYKAAFGLDFGWYLKYAEIRIEQKQRLLGSVEYLLRNDGGFNFLRWQDLKRQIHQLIDQLLKNVKQ